MKIFRKKISLLHKPLALLFIIAPCINASADERFFGYVYQADLLPAGALELEQSITNQSGKHKRDYTEWDSRTELEYGITSRLMTALYVNTQNTRQHEAPGEGRDIDLKFTGISSEWIYQILNPNLKPIGLALYGEYTTDGESQELEGKIIASKRIGKWELASNIEFEGASEVEDGAREREAVLTFSSGAAYRFTQHWSTGIEVRNKSAYPGGLDLHGQEFQAWSVGPNIHYGDTNWWATLTFLPQVWGNGDGSSSHLQLDHEERAEVRLLVGWNFS